MTTISVDADDLSGAVPQVEHLMSLLDGAARSLSGIAVPAGVPAGVASQVAHTTSAAARALQAESRALASLPADLKRRAAAAAYAEMSQYFAGAGWGMKALGMFTGSFSINSFSRAMAMGVGFNSVRAGLAAGETYKGGSWSAFRLSSTAAREAATTRGVPAALANFSKYGGKGLTGAGWALSAYSNATNPSLTTEQKIGRTGASVATGMGVAAASGAATGALLGAEAGPPGMLIGAAAGTAWSLVDYKLHISNKIGDAAADGMDAIGDGAKGVAHGAEDVAHGAKDVANGAKNLGGKALGAIGL